MFQRFFLKRGKEKFMIFFVFSYIFTIYLVLLILFSSSCRKNIDSNRTTRFFCFVLFAFIRFYWCLNNMIILALNLNRSYSSSHLKSFRSLFVFQTRNRYESLLKTIEKAIGIGIGIAIESNLYILLIKTYWYWTINKSMILRKKNESKTIKLR